MVPLALLLMEAAREGRIVRGGREDRHAKGKVRRRKLQRIMMVVECNKRSIKGQHKDQE